MLSKKDREKLIKAINVALTLYVCDKADQRAIAKTIAAGMGLPFPEHFVEACIAE